MKSSVTKRGRTLTIRGPLARRIREAAREVGEEPEAFLHRGLSDYLAAFRKEITK